MTEAARDHVRDRLEAAMRMIREPGEVVLRLVGAELVEHQERIDPPQERRADDTRELHACAVARLHPAGALLDRSIVKGRARYARRARCLRGRCLSHDLLPFFRRERSSYDHLP